MQSQTIDRLLEKIGEHEYITTVLMRFVKDKMNDEKAWRPDENIREIAKILFNDHEYKALQSLKERSEENILDLINRLEEKRLEYPEKMSELGKKAMKMIEDGGLEVSDFKYGKNGVANIFRKMRDQEKPGSEAG